jgi:hypothetical protein
MPISIIDNFQVNKLGPIDVRMIATNSAARDAITFKYDGLKVFQTDNRITYTWNASASSWDVDPVGSISGTGSAGFISRWTAQSSLGNSPIYTNVTGSLNGSPVGTVGINTPPIGSLSPKGIFQINAPFIGGAAPTVITKGTTTTISENWYNNNGDQVFNSALASNKIVFNNGHLDFFVRQPGALSNSFALRARIGLTNSVFLGGINVFSGNLVLSDSDGRISAPFGIFQKGLTTNDIFIQSKGTNTSPNNIGVVNINYWANNFTSGGNLIDLNCSSSQVRYIRAISPGTSIKFNIINGTASFIHLTATAPGDPASGYKKVWTPWGINVWNLFPGSIVELTEDTTYWKITNVRQNNQPFIDININNALADGWTVTNFPLPNPGYRVIYEQSNAYIEMRGSVSYNGSIPLNNIPFYQFPSQFGSFPTPHMFSTVCFASTNADINAFNSSKYLTQAQNTWIYVDTNRNMYADPVSCFQKDLSLFGVRIRLNNTNDITINTTTTTTGGGGGGGSS